MKNQNYRVDITDIDHTADVSISFSINSTNESIPDDTVIEKLRRVLPPEILPDKNSKYADDESYLHVGETYNDKKTGLHIYFRSINVHKQVIIGDYRSPDAEEIARAKLKVGESYTYDFENKTYEFKVLEIDGENIKVQVKEL